MCTFGLSGCRVKPRRLRGSRGLTRQPENSTCTFDSPSASNTTKIPRKDPKRKTKRAKMGREREKKARNFGLPTLRGSTLRAPTLRGSTVLGSTLLGSTLLGSTLLGSTLLGSTLLGSTLRGSTLRGPTFSRFGPPPFGAPPFEGPTLCRPKIQHPNIGRSRNWPKSKLAEVELAELEKKAGRSRNWPKSIALCVVGHVESICKNVRLTIRHFTAICFFNCVFPSTSGPRVPIVDAEPPLHK